jgi:hypothetical protein
MVFWTGYHEKHGDKAHNGIFCMDIIDPGYFYDLNASFLLPIAKLVVISIANGGEEDAKDV